MVGSQKGAPTKGSLRYAFEVILKDFVRERNKQLKEDEKIKATTGNVLKYPMPRLTMTNLPIEDSGLANTIREARHIKKVTIKLFPLNQDISMNEAVDSVNKARKSLESKSAVLTFSNSENISGLADMIEGIDNRGVAEITADLRDANGASQKISNKKRNRGNVTEASTSIGIELEKVDDNRQTINKLLSVIRNFKNSSESFFRTSKSNEDVYRKTFVEKDN